jgi:hypothetical protein
MLRSLELVVQRGFGLSLEPNAQQRFLLQVLPDTPSIPGPTSGQGMYPLS